MASRSRMLAGLAALAAAFACADRPVTAPALSQLSGTANSSWSNKGMLPGSQSGQSSNGWKGHALLCPTRLTGTDSALIGPNGGQVAVGNNRLIVPPGALRDPTWIRMTVPESEGAVVELEPSGLVFKRPAGLQLDVEGCDVPPDFVPDVFYVGHDGEIIERILAQYSNLWHTIAAAIDHFSGYIVSM